MPPPRAALLLLACGLGAGRALCVPRPGSRFGYAVQRELRAVGFAEPELPLPLALTRLDPDSFATLSSARKEVRRGHVLVNGAEARCAARVRVGDKLAFQQRVQPGYTPRGKPPFPVESVFEDDQLAVVYKPAGVVSHPPPGGAYGSRSMRTAVQYALRPPPLGTQGALYRPHLVHRLDKGTAGLLLCAKTKPTLVALGRAFAERRVRKRYAALVEGFVTADEGRIDAPIDGASAQTEWRVTNRSRSLRLGGTHLTTLALFPRSGRTHQLRRHCAEVLGTPIVGDRQHGSGEQVGSGMYLAALELEFAHPARSAEAPPLQVQIDEPAKFATLREREHARWLLLGADEAEDGASDGASGTANTSTH